LKQNFIHVLPIHIHVEIKKGHFIIINYDKVIEFFL